MPGNGEVRKADLEIVDQDRHRETRVGRLGTKTINVFRACLGAQLTICAQK